MSDHLGRRRVRRIATLAGVLAIFPVVVICASGLGTISVLGSGVSSNCSVAPSPSPSPGAASGSRSYPSPSPTMAPTPINCTGITATPAAGLADGQYVKLTFVNLQPFEGIVFRQCTAGWSNVSADCTPVNTRILGIADSNGAGSTYFPVYAYTDQKLKSANGVAIACDAQHACAIVGFSNYHNIYQTDLTFAPSPDACPPVGPNSVTGSGSAAATRAMFEWTASICAPPKSLQVQYVTSNDHAAYEDLARAGGLAAGQTAFGITGLGPYPPKDATGGPMYKLAPLTASGVVIAYRAYDMTGPQITTLTLTPDLIAQLFMGQINNFAVTRAITALNPGIAFPPRTQVVARAEFNSETYILTSWLKAVSPNIWKPPTSPSPDIFPATLTSNSLAFGERAAALNIVDPSAGFDPSVVYIGVLDSSTAAFYGLPTVKIKMPDGSALSANSASILRAIDDSEQLADGTLVPQWANFADPAAWPMPNLTYMLAPTSMIDPAGGQKVSAFLKYAVQDGQKMLATDQGYVPLPPSLVADSLAIADLIPGPVAPTARPPVTSQPPAPLPPLPPLPSVPTAIQSATGSGATGRACTSGSNCGDVNPNSRIATLSYSQGVELAAVARQQPGIPPPYVVPSLLGLTVLMTLIGLGLQAWAQWIRPGIPPRP